MKKVQENSVWSELWDAIKYCKESKNGKYTLDTYLDIVGEYTDRQIKGAEDTGLRYIGGACKVTNSFDADVFDFEINMYFEDEKGKRVIKEAKRGLPKNRFVSETSCIVGDESSFEIKRPE